MRFCLEVWGAEYGRVLDTCLLAEQLGYDAFYYGESLTPLDLDCWSVLANLAAHTRRIRLGPVITNILPGYRSIALLAKAAVTLQEISAGRLEFRTGAGATNRYAVPWWQPYGVAYPEAAERVAMLDEGLTALSLLWGEGPAHFDGRYVTLRGASMQEPRQPIPITLAASGPRMLRLAARHADTWEASYLSPQRFGELNAQFHALAKERRRSIRRSVELDVIIVASEDELRRKRQQLVRERGPRLAPQVLERSLIGTPPQVAARLQEYAQAGVEQLLLAFQDPFDAEALKLFLGATR